MLLATTLGSLSRKDKGIITFFMIAVHLRHYQSRNDYHHSGNILRGQFITKDKERKKGCKNRDEVSEDISPCDTHIPD